MPNDRDRPPPDHLLQERARRREAIDRQDACDALLSVSPPGYSALDEARSRTDAAANNGQDACLSASGGKGDRRAGAGLKAALLARNGHAAPR
jgi:hypothetical protein